MKNARRAVLCLLPLAAIAALPVGARADRAVALEGDAAPGSIGGTFSGFGFPAINDSGHVAFRALVGGDAAGEGIFLDAGSGVGAVAVSGQTAPDGGGGTFSSFGESVINGSGSVAFSAVLSGGTATRGLFRYDSGVLSALATSQTTAPGTGGGNYSAFGTRIAMNDAGEVAFFANVGSGTTTGGIFVEDGSMGRAVFLYGDPVPTGTAGTYFNVSSPAINASGEVAVTASIFLDAGGFTSGVVVATATGDRFAARVGDSAPGTGTGTYSTFNFSSAPGINAPGDVFFRSEVSTGSAVRGLFVDSDGTDSDVVLEGDEAPETGGDFFRFLDTGLSVNDDGDVGYSANTLGGSVDQGIFTSSVAGASRAVALVGADAPVPGSPTYLLLGDGASINASGAAAFRAFLSGGSAGSAIIVVPEPVGAAPWAALCISIGSLRRKRRRGR